MPDSSPSVKSARSSLGRGASKSAHKGQQTKAAIVEAALGLATQIGLEGLSIGALAEVMHMIRKGQLLPKGGIELSFADQFYVLAGKIRPV